FVDADDIDSWDEYIQPSTRMMYIETPSNPAMDIIDLEKAGRLANDNDILLVVDNCFATPYIQNPAKWGAHLVCHSATKFIDGQGRVLGGAVLGEKRFIDEVTAFARQTGPTLSPFNSWILSKSLETLAVRMEKHSENALKLAQFLHANQKVAEVKYPFLESYGYYEIAKKQMSAGGGMLVFDLKGGFNSGKKFINALEMLSVSANLGDARTTVTHPASTTHSKLSEEERQASGITDGLIRVSVGLEHVNDIIEDISQALGKA
ncbi:MAG: trans-sulfuration enzyme family protein, partial [Bacteroidota bacterium]